VLSLQLAEAQIPFVLVLNMMDEAADRGITIDVRAIEAARRSRRADRGVSGRGLSALRESLGQRGIVLACFLPEAVEQAATRLEDRLSQFAVGPRWLALMCVAGMSR